jgi:hypothetical protein
MQVSLTMAHICNSFAFLVFYLFRADGAKPFVEAKNLTKKQSEFSHGRTFTIMFARELFRRAVCTNAKCTKMPSAQMLNAHVQ